MSMIVVVDYGMGNVQSVVNALTYLGYDARISSHSADIKNASRIILPGVGAFKQGMKNVLESGLDEIIRQEILTKGKPILGICLGLQLLAQSSTEHGLTKGLGILDCDVVEFALENLNLKKPHMGWNDVRFKYDHFLFRNIPKDYAAFYFVHSFHIDIEPKNFVAGTTEYGYEFPSIVIQDNIFAVQFHPEKSQDNGLQLLKNFVEYRC